MLCLSNLRPDRPHGGARASTAPSSGWDPILHGRYTPRGSHPPSEVDLRAEPQPAVGTARLLHLQPQPSLPPVGAERASERASRRWRARTRAYQCDAPLRAQVCAGVCVGCPGAHVRQQQGVNAQAHSLVQLR